MSQVYEDAEQFEALFSRLFADLDETGGDDLDLFVQSAMVVCFDVRDPEVQMWVDGRTAPVRTTFGTTGLTATLRAGLTADDLHGLLLGTLPLGRALWTRKLHVEGSKRMAMKLEGLFHVLQAGYPALAEEILGTS